MKRVFVILLTLLVAIAVLAPPLVGYSVARQLPDLLDQWQSRLPNHTVVIIDHQRHWFSSTTQVRVIENEPQRYGVVRELAELIPFADQPAWILDVDWAHGPIPLAAVSTSGASLRPAWLFTTIHVSADTGPAGTQTFPGLLNYRLNLFGSSALHSVVRPGQLAGRFDAAELRWQDLTGSVTANAALTRYSVALSGDPLALLSPEGLNLNIAGFDLVVAANTGSNPPGGKLQLEIDEVALTDRDLTLDIDRLQIASAATMRAEHWNLDTDLRATGVQTSMGIATLMIEAGLDRVNNAWFQALSNNTQPSDWQTLLLALANQGAHLDVKKLRLQLSDSEELLASAQWHARSRDQHAASLAELVLSSEATLDIRAPKDLAMTLLNLLSERTRPVVISMLESDGTDYVVVAVLRDGVVTINGYPLPLDSVFNGG